MSRFARSTALLSVVVSISLACEHDDRCQLTATCPLEDDAGPENRPTPQPSPSEAATSPATSNTGSGGAPSVGAGALDRLPLGGASEHTETDAAEPVTPAVDAGECSDCDAAAAADASSELDSKPDAPVEADPTDSGAPTLALAELGAACTRDAQCESDHCATAADGASICCDTACRGVCEACSATGTCDDVPLLDSRCSAVECGEPEQCFAMPPTFPVGQCAGFGQCLTASEYCVPTPDEGASCGTGLVCDAQGECGKICSVPLEIFCDGKCIQPDYSDEYCGADAQCQGGSVCAPDEGCRMGSCVPRPEK